MGIFAHAFLTLAATVIPYTQCMKQVWALKPNDMLVWSSAVILPLVCPTAGTAM